MAAWLILLSIFSLFVFVDVWLLLRMIAIFLAYSFRRRNFSTNPLTKEELMNENVIKGVVMPTDLDLNFHMNNSKYLRVLDYGRIGLFLDKNLVEVSTRNNASFLVNAINIRYRRSLQLFQMFHLKTRLVCWEEKAFYLEQRMVTQDGFVVAIALVKMAIKGMLVSEIIETVCGKSKVASPLPSSDLKSWQDSINLSSKRLKEESVKLAQPSNIPSKFTTRRTINK